MLRPGKISSAQVTRSEMWVMFLQMLDALGISRSRASYMPIKGIQRLHRQHDRALEEYAQEDRVGAHASMAATSNPPRWEARFSLDSFGPDNEPLQITLPLDEFDPIGDVFTVIWEATDRLESFLFTLVRPEGDFDLLQYQAPRKLSVEEMMPEDTGDHEQLLSIDTASLMDSDILKYQAPRKLLVEEMMPEDTGDHEQLLSTDAATLIDSVLNSDEMGMRIDESMRIDLHMFCATPEDSPPPLVDEDQFAEMRITGEREHNEWLSGTIQAIYDNPDIAPNDKEAMVAALFM